ncbi:MAG: transposon-encoded TnpW family protein [Stomatobaculum sp.]|nr:transposon-encoded TnpW family protein [Bacillota bacterium]MBO5570466.1 transposon-encoded TnpW family protein [Clostridia bacterium]MBO6159678.1 transposon-encoded TnpW family protein [Bacillota bacterium]MBP3265570.1 transposon-encoded TnpW family protein [Clostridiales bacterium]MBR7058037.1 transposon-encoded TnpW family protein [Stomatobaculum sp.]
MVQEEQIPYIKRNIDGAEYTVMIHFHSESKETAKDKVKRLLLKDALNGNFPE